MDERVLKYLIENGILNLSDTRQIADMIERFKYLQMHKGKVYQGKDGYWYTYLMEETGRRKVKKKTKEEVDAAIVKFYMETEDSPTVEDIFNDWQDRRLGLGKIKKATYMRNKQVFNRHFTDICDEKITHITDAMLCEFLEDELFKHNLSSQGFSNLKSIVRGILKRAKRLGFISFSVEEVLSDIDVSDRQFKPRIVDDAKEIFYDDEVSMILAYCNEHRDDLNSLGVALMFVTGLRVGEVVALEASDILGDTIRVTKTETKFKIGAHYEYEVASYPKTPAGVRVVIVPESFLWIVDALKEHGGDTYIFINEKGERMHTQAIRKRMYQICEKLKIAKRSPHKARKTYGSILLDNHVNSKVIEKQMGHTDISTTEFSYHRDRKDLDAKRKIINALPEFENYFEN